MIEKIRNWLRDRLSVEEASPPDHLHRPSAQAPVRPKKTEITESVEHSPEIETELSGKIEDGGPGKNVLIRNKYVREDTGTHETLKIIDDSIVDSGEETGIDPYNTGGFDRSKNWHNRFRK